MRTDQRALVTLNTDLRVPYRYLERQVPLLPFRGSDRPRAVNSERAHGKQVALTGEHDGRDLLDEIRRFCRNDRWARAYGTHRSWHLNLVQMGQGLINHLAVSSHHFRAALAVSLLDRFLDV